MSFQVILRAITTCLATVVAPIVVNGSDVYIWKALVSAVRSRPAAFVETESGYAVLGTAVFGFSSSMLVARVSRAGDLEGIDLFDEESLGCTSGSEILVVEEGLSLVGTTDVCDAPVSEGYVVGIDFLGNLKWRTRLADNGAVTLNGGSVLASGVQVVTGYSVRTQESLVSSFLAEIDVDGSVLWSGEVGGLGVTTFDSALASSGNLLVVGSDRHGSAYAMEIAGEGAVVWERSYFDVLGASVYQAVSEVSAGGYIAVGKVESEGGSDICVARLSESGDMNWHRTFDVDGDDCAFSVCETAAGNFVVAGRVGGLTGNGYLSLLDATGQLRCEHVFEDLFRSRIAQVRETSSGEIVCVASAHSETFSQYIVLFSTSVLEPTFIRGDANDDRSVNLTDAIRLLSFLFLGSDKLTCSDAGDADDSGSLRVTDAVFILNHLFLGGADPVLPYPEAGLDPTIDDLSECCHQGT